MHKLVYFMTAMAIAYNTDDFEMFNLVTEINQVVRKEMTFLALNIFQLRPVHHQLLAMEALPLIRQHMTMAHQFK